MAKITLAAHINQVRASSIEENRAILREIQTKKEVQDARKQDELGTLFDDINSECCSSKSSLREKKILSRTPFNKIQNTLKPVHYGPLPGCVPGKWWAIRMDCSKDCVHVPVNQNIHDGPYGAVSICTPNLDLHSDIDLGNVLTYTGRDYKPTNRSTDSLVLSYQNQVPIRLVRSACLTNKYAPRNGYRYDGLYTVIHHWIGVSTSTIKYHKFVLGRVLNQEPPPWLDKKVDLKTARFKKSSRTHSDQEPKFVYNKVETKSKPSNVIAIVSRQVFDKCTSNSPDSALKLTLNADSANSRSADSTKLCSTNLSIRTNLYDSSHQAQDIKKAVTSVCKIFKPKQVSQAWSCAAPANSAATSEQQQAKQVGWADARNTELIRMEKSIGNGYQYGACTGGIVDGLSPKTRKKGWVVKYNTDHSTKMTKHKKPTSTTNADHISQAHSKMNFSVHELLHETEKSSESTSIDSLAPDELVSVIVKEKYHPMAKLLIGNMIGLENQEAAIVNAYNALTKVNQDDSKQPKENKLRNKFSIKSPSKKNGISKKQRREIANLTIDAKFDTRSSRSRGLGASSKRILKSESNRRKLMNARRIQSRGKGIAMQTSKNVRNPVVDKVQKTVTVWTQCSLLAAPVPTVDQCQQTEDLEMDSPPSMKVELVDLDEVKSAFAAVSADSNDRIARLRSIGFRPIAYGDSPTQEVESDEESSKQDVDQEYNKYTSEENDVVGYMDEQLHFEDIEEEEKMCIEGDSFGLTHKTNILPQPIETLTEHDFNKPWHGWRKISINGQTYWTGC